ncbi:MAG TPA: helix-hairpin-helix domain-containing protein [Methylomirabilota bacterium]|jgi:competence protein ComEA
MALYTRRQVVVLLIPLAVAGLGLAIGHWRRASPDVANSLEQLDRAPMAPSSPVLPRPEGGGPAMGSESDPRRSRRGKPPAESTRPRSVPEPSSGEIDLNRATPDELTRLPGVGPALARRIVDARASDGPFTQIDELGRVRGISARTIDKLRAFVTVAR